MWKCLLFKQNVLHKGHNIFIEIMPVGKSVVAVTAFDVFVDGNHCFSLLSEAELAQLAVACKQQFRDIQEYLNEAKIDHRPHVRPRTH